MVVSTFVRILGFLKKFSRLSDRGKKERSLKKECGISFDERGEKACFFSVDIPAAYVLCQKDKFPNFTKITFCIFGHIYNKMTPRFARNTIASILYSKFF